MDKTHALQEQMDKMQNLLEAQFSSKDQKEKARQLRFLQQRGFNAEQSFAALDCSPEDEL